MNDASDKRLPITTPQRDADHKGRRPARRRGKPDLRIVEIEEKHVPKDRNIFDK